jgi:hypothetical protein
VFYTFYSLSVLNGVAGHLPLELGNITELTKIYIRDSDLSAGPVPETIGLCTQLVKVVLDRSNLQGRFPTGLRQLKSLGISIRVMKQTFFHYMATFSSAASQTGSVSWFR